MKTISNIDRLDLVTGFRDIITKLAVDSELAWKLKRRFSELVGRLPMHGTAPSTTNEEVLGERIGIDALTYHVDCLTHLDWEDPLARQKVRFHLLLAGSALDRVEQSFMPLVSIVIAVSNGREHIRSTIESCTRQSYPLIEIVIVDAASTDGTSEIVGGLSGPIHLIRIEDPNIAVARNRGIRAANGDFVHFLEVGDELISTAVADKLAAWRDCPDARLCYSRWISRSDVSADFVPLRQRQEDPGEGRSPLGDAMLSACSRFPFAYSTVMTPRWFLDQVGPFDEDMRGGEEARYWFRMARNGLKVSALQHAKTVIRSRESASLGEEIVAAIEADLRNVADLSDEPRLYRYVVSLMARATWLLDKAFDEGVSQELIETFHRRFLDLEATIGQTHSAEGLTSLLLDQLIFMLRQKQQQTKDATRPMLRLWHEREEQLLDRIARVSYVTGSDLRRWLPDLPPRPFADLRTSEQISLKFALEQLQVSLVLGELPIRFRSLERVAADYPGHPYERYWNGAFRLAHLIGDEAARSIVRQKFYRSGWQFLGRARRAIQFRDAV